MDVEANKPGFMKSGRQYALRLPQTLSEAVCALPRTSDFVFTVDGRKPINSETLRRNFQKFDKITTHGFRNTFETWALNQKPAIDKISIFLCEVHACCVAEDPPVAGKEP